VIFKEIVMNKKITLVLAGSIFTIVSAFHLLRIFYHIEITFGGSILPMWTSFIGLAISLLLAIWMFTASRG
jgi:hypothetical protein